jgi:hypothetical protein
MNKFFSVCLSVLCMNFVYAAQKESAQALANTDVLVCAIMQRHPAAIGYCAQGKPLQITDMCNVARYIVSSMDEKHLAALQDMYKKYGKSDVLCQNSSCRSQVTATEYIKTACPACKSVHSIREFCSCACGTPRDQLLHTNQKCNLFQHPKRLLIDTLDAFDTINHQLEAQEKIKQEAAAKAQIQPLPPAQSAAHSVTIPRTFGELSRACWKGVRLMNKKVAILVHNSNPEDEPILKYVYA